MVGVAHQASGVQHPAKARARLPQQRQPDIAVVDISVVNVLALTAARGNEGRLKRLLLH
jgi:hypothetical protein